MTKIRNRVIANYVEPYVIAEIGANHNGDMELAKQMIEEAKACGCDAIKFQSWTPESLVSEEEYARNQKYDDSPKKHFGSLREMIDKYHLRKEQHMLLKDHCDRIGIEFCSTPFSKEEVDLLEELEVPFYKIASMDINNIVLLDYVSRKGKTVILSTGMSTLAEIENAVKVIENTGNMQIVLLHCIALYPPAYEDINLNNIPMLQRKFNYPVGFSDHSIGTSIPLASVVLGACLIEKHFTLDKDMPGWDHDISADPKEMEIVVNESKNIVKALGSHRRVVGRSEEEKKLKFRRSIVAGKNLKKGFVVSAKDLLYKRPGTGIKPDEAKYVVGKQLARDICKDELIQWSDLM